MNCAKCGTIIAERHTVFDCQICGESFHPHCCATHECDRGAQIARILRSGGVAVKDSWFAGSTGHATFYSDDMARRAAHLLQAAGFTVRGPIESLDECKDQASRTTLAPKRSRVWRIGMYLR